MILNLTGLSLCHGITMVMTTIVPVIGVGVGQGLASRSIIRALDFQPEANAQLIKLFTIALAILETAVLLGILAGGILAFSPARSLPEALAHIGVGCAIGLPAGIIGFASSFSISNALFSLARQPLHGSKITNLLLLAISVAQTPVILGFVLSMFIMRRASGVTGMADGIRLLASGLSLGIGSIGPAIGIALFGAQACKGVGINRDSYSNIFSFTFLSQAMIEAPVLFSLVVALWMLFLPFASTTPLVHGIICITAAVTMGLATLVTGISSGRTSRTACLQIAYHPELYSELFRTSLLSQGVIDANAVYGLIMSTLMILSITTT